jgi:hypothetical protein
VVLALFWRCFGAGGTTQGCTAQAAGRRGRLPFAKPSTK